MNETVLYVGALDDLIPLMLLPKATTFIYVDQCPADADGHFANCVGQAITGSIRVYFGWLFFCLENIDHMVTAVSFQPQDKLCVIDLDYHGTIKKMYYFYNTSFPEDVNQSLKTLMHGATILFMNGYTPKLDWIPCKRIHLSKSAYKISLLDNLRAIWASKYCVDAEINKYCNSACGIELRVLDVNLLNDLSDKYNFIAQYGTEQPRVTLWTSRIPENLEENFSLSVV